MRWVLAAAIVPIALAAHADTIHPGVTGNNSGGIIQWGPDAKYFYRDIAAYHCARFNKIAVISSVHRRYGEYAGFRCYFPRSTIHARRCCTARIDAAPDGPKSLAEAADPSRGASVLPGSRRRRSTPRLHRRRDRPAIAAARRHAFVGAAGIEHGVAEPQATADDDDDDRQQNEVGIATFAVGFRRLVRGGRCSFMA